MNVTFTEEAWNQYNEWLYSDKSIARKINELIKDIKRNGFNKGIGKPEPLKGRKEWSRRITQEHRLVYMVDSEKNLIITACAGHYD